MSDYSFARAWRTVATLAPERTAIVCGARRLTFGEFHEAAARLAGELSEAGLKAGDKVAIELINCPEYLISFFAAQLIGCVPVNVNYRYVGSELAYLLDNSDAAALIYHDDFADTVNDALADLDEARRPTKLIEITRGAEPPAIQNTRPLPMISHEPSGDDLIFIYTGGTTGSPKAVMWRSDDLYVALWQMARPNTQPPDPADTIARDRTAASLLPACPLMHGTGLFMALTTLSGGGKVVLIDSARLDAAATWSAVEREQVQVLTIVGDAFARPLLDELDRTPTCWDLSGLRAITSSGVTWSPECKHGLLRYLPGITLIDSLGASEGVMTRSVARADADVVPANFKLSERLVVIADDDALIEPGDDRIGILGVGGPIPLGYYKDEAKTAATFRNVGGRRYSVPGDYATVGTDGTLTLLGRGSACINTGGEKVYPEEVELVVRSHPAVTDCVVVGVPDTRWGEMVVALVCLSDDTANGSVDSDVLHAHCRERTAGYKVPKQFFALDSLQRSPAGKADYALLRDIAARRLEGTKQ